MINPALVDAIAAHDDETIAQAIVVGAELDRLDPKVCELVTLFSKYKRGEVGQALNVASADNRVDLVAIVNRVKELAAIANRAIEFRDANHGS